MRKWVIYLAAFAVAAMWNVAGFSGTDVGKLLPVEALRISVADGEVLLETDTADAGKGKNVHEAVADLKNTARGKMFLETADYLILQPGCEDLLRQLKVYLRPSCGVCLETQKTEPEKAAVYLSVHEPAVTLQDWCIGGKRLPVLVVRGERMELVQ